MNIGKKGVKLIQSFEGCRLTSYKDSVGVWTIGYGHTGTLRGRKLTGGMRISKNEATKLLKADLKKFCIGVDKLVRVKLKQHQFDALVSFSYNLGLGSLQKSTLLRYVNRKLFTRASVEFLKWDKAGGRVLAGLKRRREAEKRLFLNK